MAYPGLSEAMAAGQTLGASVLDGTFLSGDHRKANVKAAYDLLGYALSVTVGDPAEITFGSAPMSDDAFAAACMNVGGTSEGAVAAIDWKAMLQKLLAILVQLLG